MTYLQILNLIKDTALAQPNVNSVVREFLDLNREDAKYSAIVIQDRDGSRDRTEEQNYITYTWHLGYVDRLTYDESNRDDIISTGINIIDNIMNTIRNTWFPELEVSIIDRINTFNQRFTAQCAGVYVVLAVNVQVSDCVDSESNDLYDTYDAKITANGVYHFVPSGRPVDKINITVDVAGPKKEEVSLTDTVTMNGIHTYIPEEDTVYKDVELTVDVHPTERLVQTITNNGITDLSGEWKDASITVDVHPSASLSETYISNGSYNITGEFNGGVITVDVPISGWDQKNVTEGTIEIINLDNSASFVTSNAFIGNTNIQTVNLPYATSVGSFAFQSCFSLTQVSLPICSYIGENAFEDCSSLSQISLPMCSYIGNYVFMYCNSLTQVSLPVCSYIGSAAFQGCSSLSQVNLPMCREIDNIAFRFCSSLSIIIIGYSDVCTLPHYDPFNGTPIASGTGSIYVPASLVDVYKSARDWSKYSSQIFSIPS